MKPESRRTAQFRDEFANLALGQGERRAAEAVDAAVAAAWSGVDGAAVRRAWGDEAAGLAFLAGRLAERTGGVLPQPTAAFARALELRVADAFDARRTRRAWPRPRFGRLKEISLVGGAALVLALGALLLNPGPGWAPSPTPTALAGTEAATETATVATPEARTTARSETAPSG